MLSEVIPPTMREKMQERGIKSVSSLERQLQVSNGYLRHYLSDDKASIRRLISLLVALGYTCDAPEFALINEICAEKDLKGLEESSKISSVKKRQSRHAQKEQILYLMFPGLTKSA